MSSINGSQNTEGPKWVSARPTPLTKKSVPENIPQELEKLGETLKASEQNLGLDTSLAGRITQSPLPLVEVDREKYAGFQEAIKNKGALPKPPELKRARESEEADTAPTKRARTDSDTESVASSTRSNRLSTSILDRTLNAFLSIFKTETAEPIPFDPEKTRQEIQELDKDITGYTVSLQKAEENFRNNEATFTEAQKTAMQHQLDGSRNFIDELKSNLKDKKSLLAAYRGAEDAKQMPSLMARYENDKPLKSERGLEELIQKNPEGSPHYKILKNIQEQINQAYSFRNDMIRLGKLAQFIQEQPELTEAQKNTFQRGLPDVIEGAADMAKAVKNLETTYFGSKVQFENELIDPEDNLDIELLTHFLNELSSVFGNQEQIVKTFSEATSNYNQIIALTTPISNNPKVENFNERLIQHGKNIGIDGFAGIKGLGTEYIKPAQRFMRIPMLLEESAKSPIYSSTIVTGNLQNSRNAASEINRLPY